MRLLARIWARGLEPGVEPLPIVNTPPAGALAPINCCGWLVKLEEAPKAGVAAVPKAGGFAFPVKLKVGFGTSLLALEPNANVFEPALFAPKLKPPLLCG